MSKVQHVSTVTVDPATGQPTYHQDIQGGPATTSAYDSVGRVLTMRTAGTQPVEQRLSACTASANCLVRRQSFQAGAPIKTEYMDLLGRVVATGAEGFDGLEIVTKVAYNEPGLKVAEYAPWKSSVLPGQWDGSSGLAIRHSVLAHRRPGAGQDQDRGARLRGSLRERQRRGDADHDLHLRAHRHRPADRHRGEQARVPGRHPRHVADLRSRRQARG